MYKPSWARLVGALRPTGTFFCDMTTAQAFPLTPTEVMLAAVMALNAYSGMRVCKRRDLILYTNVQRGISTTDRLDRVCLGLRR